MRAERISCRRKKYRSSSELCRVMSGWKEVVSNIVSSSSSRRVVTLTPTRRPTTLLTTRNCTSSSSSSPTTRRRRCRPTPPVRTRTVRTTTPTGTRYAPCRTTSTSSKASCCAASTAIVSRRTINSSTESESLHCLLHYRNPLLTALFLFMLNSCTVSCLQARKADNQPC